MVYDFPLRIFERTKKKNNNIAFDESKMSIGALQTNESNNFRLVVIKIEWHVLKDELKIYIYLYDEQ